MDLLKPLPQSIFVGKDHEDSPLKGYTQKLEYEGVPKYCKHYRKIGHYMINCRALEKKTENKEEEKETQNQGNGNQLTIEQEGSKANVSSNEKPQNLLTPEITQKQQNKEVNCKNKKNRKKKIRRRLRKCQKRVKLCSSRLTAKEEKDMSQHHRKMTLLGNPLKKVSLAPQQKQHLSTGTNR